MLKYLACGKDDILTLPLVHGFPKAKNNLEDPIIARVISWLMYGYYEFNVSKNTLETEKNLNIPSSLYLYLMKAQHPYDQFIFVFKLKKMPETVKKGISPFDSGGLWHGYHLLSYGKQKKRIIFNKFNYKFSELPKVFSKHLACNFPKYQNSVLAYINCKTPYNPWWAGFRLSKKKSNTSSKLHCWEVRIPREETKNVLDLSCVFMTFEQYSLLENLFTKNRDLDLSALRNKVDKNTITNDNTSPLVKANQYLQFHHGKGH